MKARQTDILHIVNERQRVEVTELAEALSVSGVTIRKDLDALEEMGLLHREHGYACAVSSDDINNRLAYNYETKSRIAHAAAEIVEDGETVMIESGSCCAMLAEILVRDRRDVSIITNSAFIADYVRHAGNSGITLLGGDYQRESQVMVGPLVRICAREFFVDKLFMGTDGFIPQAGFTCSDMSRAEAMRNLSESARNVIILTDSTKFERQGVVLQLRFDRVQMVFTDEGIADEARKVLRKNRVEVRIA